MSAKLVRKMLQQQAAAEVDHDDISVGAVEDASALRQSKKRKRRVKRQTHEGGGEPGTAVVLDEEERLQRHVQSKIRLDRTIHAHSGVVAQTLQQRRSSKEAKKQSKLRSKALHAGGGVGNSRGSSFQKMTHKHEPTFNKKRHQAETREKMLRDVAKLLKKSKKTKK